MNHTVQDELFELMKERFLELNELLNNLWLSYSNKSISHSEWSIISQISEQTMFISEVSKNMAISRQATHKLIKQLEEKGIVEIFQNENNKRDKCISLTPLGEQCYKKYMELKKELENNIKEKIGEQNIKSLKTILKSDWGI